jgi:branched-chain amino acid transport system substrate-binding protein
MVNDTGGIDGHHIELEAKDDAYEAARAVSNVKTLVEADDVMATLLQLGTAQASAVQALHETQCTPQLAVSSGAPNFYDPAEHQFSTANFFPYAANGSLMAQFLESEFPEGAKVGELIWNNDFGAIASGAFNKALEGTSVKVVSQVEHDSTAVSLSSQVTTLLSKSPDALVASTGSGYCSQFIGAARDKGFDGPILLPYSCSDASDVLAPLGNKAANVFAGQSLVDPSSGAETQGTDEYAQWLEEYAPKADAKSSFVAMGYQMAALLTEQLTRAAESEDGLSRVGLMKAVWSTDAEIGLNYPGQKTTVNGEFPYPIGYAVMSEYDPKAGAWMATDVDVMANGEKP